MSLTSTQSELMIIFVFLCLDVHSTQHSSHATQLSRRNHHVLQVADVRMRRRQRSRRFWPGVYGVLSSSPLLRTGLRLFLGLLAPQPPACLAAPVLSYRPPRAPSPPPSHAPAAHVAARLPARQRPADASHFSPARPEMRGGDGFNGGSMGWECSLRLWMAEGGKTWYSFFLFSKDEQSLLLEISFCSFIYCRFSFLSKPGEEPLWRARKKMMEVIKEVRESQRSFFFVSADGSHGVRPDECVRVNLRSSLFLPLFSDSLLPCRQHALAINMPTNNNGGGAVLHPGKHQEDVSVEIVDCCYMTIVYFKIHIFKCVQLQT